MAKIGTAHVEIKPVISDEVLEAITARIADAVAEGVERGMAAANKPVPLVGNMTITSPGAFVETFKDRKGDGGLGSP